MKVCSKKLDPTLKTGIIREFEDSLRTKVIGQEEALAKMTEVYQTFKAKMNPLDHPIANLLFLGPTGTGKTRAVEALAETVFGDTKAVIKIDCAEFQHSHEIAKLIGSPPGYLGHRETHPLLTQEALNQWHTDDLKLTLLLFDEIEKASDSLWNLLLGILDKAVLTLGDNRRVDLSSCIIFMTSNLGASEMTALAKGGMGFGTASVATVNAKFDAKVHESAVASARRKFSPEFMNRIDKVVVFKTLRPEHLEQILEIELGMVQQRILHAPGNSQFVFTCTPAVKKALLQEGTDSKSGARELKRVIEKRLVFPISNLISTGQLKLGDVVKIDLEDGEFIFIREAEHLLIDIPKQSPARPSRVTAATLGSRRPERCQFQEDAVCPQQKEGCPGGCNGCDYTETKDPKSDLDSQ